MTYPDPLVDFCRIVTPTCNQLRQYPPITLALLNRYWPHHPTVDLLHYECFPPSDLPIPAGVTFHFMGEQAQQSSWCYTLLQYVRNSLSRYLLLMLDDYALCAPPTASINLLLERLQTAPDIACLHLTWQPLPTTARKHLAEWCWRLPAWDYTVNTQAAIWRRDALLQVLELLHARGVTSIEDFELTGSRIWNNCLAHRLTAEVKMPIPTRVTPMVDKMDKTHWVLPYHNLSHRGRFDPRHVPFLQAENLPCPQNMPSS